VTEVFRQFQHQQSGLLSGPVNAARPLLDRGRGVNDVTLGIRAHIAVNIKVSTQFVSGPTHSFEQGLDLNGRRLEQGIFRHLQ